jgi:hypothetical protein
VCTWRVQCGREVYSVNGRGTVWMERVRELGKGYSGERRVQLGGKIYSGEETGTVWKERIQWVWKG